MGNDTFTKGDVIELEKFLLEWKNSNKTTKMRVQHISFNGLHSLYFDYMDEKDVDKLFKLNLKGDDKHE